MKYEEYAGREGDIVTGIIQQSDARYTLLDLGRVEALLPQAEQVPYERPEANTPGQGLHRRGPQDGQGSPDRGQPHPSRAHQAPLRARGARDRRRRGRDQGLCPRARAPHQDRRVVQRPERRPGRRLRRRPRRSGPHGRQRAAGREDRHRALLRRFARLRHEGAVAGQGQRGPHRRRRPAPPRSSCPTTSCRWPSARRGRTPASPPGSPAGGSTSRARPSWPRKRPTRPRTGPQGEWIIDPETGEQVWQPADGTDAISADQWTSIAAEQGAEAEGEGADGDETAPADSDAEPEADDRGRGLGRLGGRRARGRRLRGGVTVGRRATANLYRLSPVPTGVHLDPCRQGGRWIAGHRPYTAGPRCLVVCTVVGLPRAGRLPRCVLPGATGRGAARCR